MLDPWPKVGKGRGAEARPWPGEGSIGCEITGIIRSSQVLWAAQLEQVSVWGWCDIVRHLSGDSLPVREAPWIVPIAAGAFHVSRC